MDNFLDLEVGKSHEIGDQLTVTRIQGGLIYTSYCIDNLGGWRESCIKVSARDAQEDYENQFAAECHEIVQSVRRGDETLIPYKRKTKRDTE